MAMLTLPALCDRAAARALLPDFRDGIGPEPLAIEAGAVERVGQAMLQLLVSAARSEGGIALHGPSDALLDALRLTGLERELLADIHHGQAGEQGA